MGIKLTETQKRFILIGLAVLLLLFIILFMILYKKQYHVTFNSNGGSQIATIKIKENGKIEKPEDPLKDGYIFAGWYYYDELYDFDTPVVHNITLEARWLPVGEAEIEGITLNMTELNLTAEQEANLIATLLPENAKIVKLVWSSSDESIVTVDENGKVKAIKEGSATITVATEDGNYAATCKVTVAAKEETPAEDTNNDNSKTNNNDNNNNNNSNNNNNNHNNNNNSTAPTTPNNPTTPSKPEEQNTQTTVSVESLSLGGKSEMYVGDTQTLTLTINPSNATNKKVTWSSSNSSSVTVDGNGKVTAKAVGTATITVKSEDGGKEAKITITIKEKPASYVITLTEYKQSGTGNVMEYTYSVTKNGANFTDYEYFQYGDYTVYRQSGALSEDWINTSIKSVQLTLNDGTTVTATVRY